MIRVVSWILSFVMTVGLAVFVIELEGKICSAALGVIALAYIIWFVVSSQVERRKVDRENEAGEKESWDKWQHGQEQVLENLEKTYREGERIARRLKWNLIILVTAVLMCYASLILEVIQIELLGDLFF